MRELIYGLYENSVDEKINELSDYAVEKLFGKERMKENIPLDFAISQEESNKSNLDEKHIVALKGIVGDSEVSTNIEDRISVSFSRTTIDVVKLTEKCFDELCDVVIYPSTSEQIEKVVEYCDDNDLMVYCYNGTYDNRDDAENCGAVCVDLRKNYNGVVNFNEIDKTITVEAGMSLIRLEDILVHGRKYFKSLGAYTLRYFPIDFDRGHVSDVALSDFSADIVLSQKIVESENSSAYIPTEVTVAVYRCIFENRKQFAYLFDSFEDTVFAARTIKQSECGGTTEIFSFDEFLTELIFKAEKIDGKNGCLLFGYTDGEKKYCDEIFKRACLLAEKHGGTKVEGTFDLLIPSNAKLLSLRDAMLKKNVVLDTVNIPIKWSKLEETRLEILESYKDESETRVLTYLSRANDNDGVLSVVFVTDNVEEEIE